jgi:hypothetical protein
MAVFQKGMRLKRRDTGFHNTNVFHSSGVDKSADDQSGIGAQAFLRAALGRAMGA